MNNSELETEVIIKNIITNINNIYENINISKAFFLIEPILLDNIYKILKENDYPVCILNDSDKFIQHKARIILINNIDINKIYNNYELINEFKNVNLIIFIETPRIYDRYFYKSFFNIKTLTDENINIFEL